MPYVHSTLTNDNVYTKYAPMVNDLPRIEKKVLIKGGSNVANERLITPLGVPTKVTEEELAVCEGDPVFRQHKENGFIRVTNTAANSEKVAADMVTRDASAPLVPEDYQEGGKARPIVGIVTNKKVN